MKKAIRSRNKFSLTIFKLLSFFVTTFLFQSVAFADINQFVGEWKNVDPNTGSIARFTISQSGKNLTARFYGACNGGSCDMGETQAVAYAPTVCEDSIEKTAMNLTAHYEPSKGVDESFVIMPMQNTDNMFTGRKLLQVISFTKFNELDGRMNQSTVNVFYYFGPKK